MDEFLAVASNRGNGKGMSLVELVVDVTGLPCPIPHLSLDFWVSGREHRLDLTNSHFGMNPLEDGVERGGNKWLVFGVGMQQAAAEQESEDYVVHRENVAKPNEVRLDNATPSRVD